MLPAPFYTELPADLGDEQTWVQQALDCRWQSECLDPPSRSLAGVIGGVLADSLAICLGWLRSVVQP